MFVHNKNTVKNVMYIFNDINIGGAARSLVDILSKVKYKINPTVIVHDNIEVEQIFIEQNIHFYKLHFHLDYVKIGNSNEEKRLENVIESYKVARQLLPIIEKENIHLIHINSSVSSFGAIAALMANIPYIWHVRELMEEQFNCEFLNETLKHYLYKKSDSIITISDYVKDEYHKKYRIDTKRIYNGLDIKKYKMNIDKDKKYNSTFLVAAMITPEKRQWDVIQATQMLVKDGYVNIKVIIVGKGEDRYVWALKKYITRNKLEKNIFILPFQSDLSELRKQSSYAITSSQNEALGRVTIEAMLAGNLVIGARSGGTIEIIGESEERGILYELGNVDALAKVMLKVMNYSNSDKYAIINRAQSYAEKTFDSIAYCDNLIKLYDKVIESFIPKKAENFLNEIKIYCEVSKEITNNVRNDDVFLLLKKSNAAFAIAVKWIEIRQKGYSFKQYFKKENIFSVAIYGIAELGRRLYDELERSEIEVKYFIDRSSNGLEGILPFIMLENGKIDVDAIVVTVALDEQKIIDEIIAKGNNRVIGISEMLKSFDKI